MHRWSGQQRPAKKATHDYREAPCPRSKLKRSPHRKVEGVFSASRSLRHGLTELCTDKTIGSAVHENN